MARSTEVWCTVSPSVAVCHIDRMSECRLVVSVWSTLFIWSCVVSLPNRVCVCASLPMQCFHSFNISADSEQWQRWTRDLWLYTSWTPEELEKTLQGRRTYQAGHIAARAKARLMHVSAVRRSPLHSVALTRTCHCARVTHPFVCRHARVTQPFVYIYVCMYIYIHSCGRV